MHFLCILYIIHALARFPSPVHILFIYHSKNFHFTLIFSSFVAFILRLSKMIFYSILSNKLFHNNARQKTVWHPPFSGHFLYFKQQTPI